MERNTTVKKVKELIIEYLKKNHWSKEIVEKLGEEWVQELHFETRQIILGRKESGIIVLIPLPNCNNGWTKRSFALADHLIEECPAAWYDWNIMYEFNKDRNKGLGRFEREHYLCVYVSLNGGSINKWGG